jgi:hypothetical protein
MLRSQAPASSPAPAFPRPLQLRKRLRHAFPGGPPKQSTIVHASIARLLTPQQLTPQQIEAVQASLGEEPADAGWPAYASSLMASAPLSTAPALPCAPVPRLQGVCDAWSERLRGMRFDPDRIYHIQACALGCVRSRCARPAPPCVRPAKAACLWTCMHVEPCCRRAAAWVLAMLCPALIVLGLCP